MSLYGCMLLFPAINFAFLFASTGIRIAKPLLIGFFGLLLQVGVIVVDWNVYLDPDQESDHRRPRLPSVCFWCFG